MDGNVLTVWGQFFKSFIDRTTMYRLMFYYLAVLFIAALALSAAGYLSFPPTALLWSAIVLTIASWLSNKLFARVFGAFTNLESVFITAIILTLILSPTAPYDIGGSITLAVVAIIASASKYILAFRKKHIFNPVALALALSILLGVQTAWWVSGSLFLLPLVIIGGLIIVYKLQKFDLILSFFAASLVTVALASTNFIAGIQVLFLYSAIIFFFAFVMLTEPQTMPNTRTLRVVYGALVGALFIWAPSIGSLHFSPELALIVGNLFAFVVGQKDRYTLALIKRNQLASGIYEYIFQGDRKTIFKSGQYLEWTLGGVPYDNRGNRRFFTIASAPEDENIALATRFSDKPSAFKKTLAQLPVGAVVSASSIAGNFTMPKDTRKKLAFLAGGIGVTPFASMARHCIKAGENRDAVLLYASKNESEVAYRDIFTSASRCGWRTVYRIGAIDAEFIKQEVPDYLERIFYISGPHGMVSAMKSLLIDLGVSRFSIKTDFFPGLA